LCKCRIVLEEKQIPYEPVLQRPFPTTPELLAMNPMGKVPILKDGGLVVPDSSVICAYLERAHPARPMYPDDAGGNARALFLEEYADTALNGATIWVYVERVLHDECDEARVNKILSEDLPPVLDYIES
jgi:glutathione S-transferase